MIGVGANGEVSESSSIEEIEDTLSLVTTEINRRLQAGRVRDVADGILFRYHQDLTKAAERNKDKEEKKESREFDLLEQIHFLPDDRAKELLRAEIASMKRKIKQYEKQLKEYDASKV